MSNRTWRHVLLLLLAALAAWGVLLSIVHLVRRAHALELRVAALEAKTAPVVPAGAIAPGQGYCLAMDPTTLGCAIWIGPLRGVAR